MVGWRKVTAGFSLLAAMGFAGAQGCSSSSSAPAPGAPPTVDDPKEALTLDETKTLVCGSIPTVDSHGAASSEPEYFILSAMNRKLHYFPEFARAIGMQSVTNCDSARKFYVAYGDYFDAHPGFDNHLPPLPVPNIHDLVAKKAEGHPPDVTKVLNGTPSGFSAVVQFGYSAPKPAPSFWDNSGKLTDTACSGVFIAKNWIATAAHCVYEVSMLQAPTAANGWGSVASYPWQIRFADASGNIGRMLGSKDHPLYLVSMADPDYIGFSNAYNAAHGGDDATPVIDDAGKIPFQYPHDFALMYVDPLYYDGHLPGFYTTAFTVGFGAVPANAVYLNTEDFDLSWTLSLYAYGPTADNIRFGSGQTSGMVPPTLTFFNDTNISTTTQTNTGTVAACPGDSGGALVRSVGTAGQFALVGNVSGIHHGKDNCASVDGETTTFTRTDFELPFIQESMQTFYGPQFSCTTPVLSPPADGTYVQCFGKPCQSSCDCDPTTFCSNPAIQSPASPYFSGADSCDVCPDIGLGAATCNCLFGQCLPRPVDLAGNDVSDAATCDAF
jgi:V8-like Glu-specific endopeptidase